MFLRTHGLRGSLEKLTALCARLVGHPLDAPLTFALRPFSPQFEQLWQRTLAYVWPADQLGLEAGTSSNGAFDEYLCTLLVNHHPHNYSDELAGPAPARGVRRAAECHAAPTSLRYGVPAPSSRPAAPAMLAFGISQSGTD
jgi:hypothetical protein